MNGNNPGKQVIVTITGKDAPGITSSLTEILNREGVRLLDIEQSVTHGLLSLSIVIEFAETGGDEAAVLKDLLFKAKELGITLDFIVVEGEAVLRSSSTQFAITLMSGELQARHVAAISAVLAKRRVNIDSIRKLNEGGLSCIELITYTNSEIDIAEVKDDLLKVAGRFSGLDIAVQRENLFRRAKRLVVMDMDSTLIQVEVIDELAKLYGVGRQVGRITERAMAGELDYDQSIRERVGLLKGLSESRMKEVADQIPLTPGADTLIRTLKRLGYKIALISGGFSYFGNHLQEKLGLHYVHTNELEIQNGVLTGKLLGPIVNAERKAELLESIAAEEGVPLESTIAIGDGANDVLMLKKAGLGIAFNAKKKARSAADAAINQKTLASILYLLGITDKDIEEVSKY
ncbi:MAG: phosphoserine phosphatase SerB [Deltaproteobacteria bacterium]|nr:phosphoserine phosphatase SerB [Deltaproteobacteria bacterium]